MTPVLPGLFSNAPVVPSSLTVAPSARASRRSGHLLHTGQRQPTRSMLVYRDALRRVEPATDQDVAFTSGLALASINGRRNDWDELSNGCIEAVDRVNSPGGGRCWRTRWRIRPGSIADTAEAAS